MTQSRPDNTGKARSGGPSALTDAPPGPCLTAVNVGVVVGLLDEPETISGWSRTFPAPIEMADLVATERPDVPNRG
jgi:hypothetical protein